MSGRHILLGACKQALLGVPNKSGNAARRMSLDPACSNSWGFLITYLSVNRNFGLAESWAKTTLIYMYVNHILSDPSQLFHEKICEIHGCFNFDICKCWMWKKAWLEKAWSMWKVFQSLIISNLSQLEVIFSPILYRFTLDNLNLICQSLVIGQNSPESWTQ